MDRRRGSDMDIGFNSDVGFVCWVGGWGSVTNIILRSD